MASGPGSPIDRARPLGRLPLHQLPDLRFGLVRLSRDVGEERDGSTYYAPLAGIAPGEVALLEVPPLPGSPIKMSTGVMVIYADSESFAFMTPEGHALSAWITFSGSRDGDTTVAQVQALERTSDPFIELSYILGANRMNDRFWEQTLQSLARSVGVESPVVTATKVCVDRRRQWRHVRNLRHSPALAMAFGTLTAPARWLRRRRAA